MRGAGRVAPPAGAGSRARSRRVFAWLTLGRHVPTAAAAGAQAGRRGVWPRRPARRRYLAASTAFTSSLTASADDAPGWLKNFVTTSYAAPLTASGMAWP